MRRKLSLILTFLFLTSCQSNESAPHSSNTSQEISGRNQTTDQPPYTRPQIYRVKAPANWKRITPSPTESIADTTKALSEFQITDGEELIRITIHNFPTDTLEERIPPAAQIARWRRQFSSLDPTKASVIPQARGGFTGLQFEGTGVMNGQMMTVLGWSMQLSNEHYRSLKAIEKSDGTDDNRQMRADYTIKAAGQSQMMDKYREPIIEFARSFELIDEIPTHS